MLSPKLVLAVGHRIEPWMKIFGFRQDYMGTSDLSGNRLRQYKALKVITSIITTRLGEAKLLSYVELSLELYGYAA